MLLYYRLLSRRMRASFAGGIFPWAARGSMRLGDRRLYGRAARRTVTSQAGSRSICADCQGRVPPSARRASHGRRTHERSRARAETELALQRDDGGHRLLARELQRAVVLHADCRWSARQPAGRHRRRRLQAAPRRRRALRRGRRRGRRRTLTGYRPLVVDVAAALGRAAAAAAATTNSAANERRAGVNAELRL